MLLVSVMGLISLTFGGFYEIDIHAHEKANHGAGWAG